ncbi:MAG: ribosomal L7Ae/L30e/S12e/Gadd45 family protein [Clostridia bacterium]|nr:ribosomal L7Ae/L30e/S12e/Gadd45 family protein [Clostridia bacterium]
MRTLGGLLKKVNNKLLTLLGFAAKAGKLSYGMDMSQLAVKTGKSFLVIAACDVSEKSKKEITFHTNNKSVPFIVLDGVNIETVSKAVGRKCGILSVNDKSFAEAIRGGYANDQ